MAEKEMADTKSAEQLERLTVVATATDGMHVLTLSEEIDHDTGDAFRQALNLAGTPCPRVVVDLRQVAFMDSSGINVLIAAHRALTGAGGWLRLAGPTGVVLRTLQLVGVDTVIDCHENLDEALTGRRVS
ncbi:STAS domain-containing protein [Streptomyces sp. DSM 118148]|uniref:STAS domain-containing protein n=1 Tax=Streptomyces sp. DSM 118148 TaxID=3448667 RepID=UPI0040402624